MMRRILSVVLAAYVLCLFVIMSPPSPVTNALAEMANPLVSWLGSVTAFGIMGPQVLRRNIYYSAEVKFVDGTTKDWEFPHYIEGQTSDWQRQRQAFYFLWQYNMALNANSPELQQSAFRYVARMFRDQNRKPVFITLYEHTNEVPDLTSTIQPVTQPVYTSKPVLERPTTDEDFQ